MASTTISNKISASCFQPEISMAIEITGKSRLHWNYFLALEQDMERATRYIEFHKNNEKVFSIELAHLLFAAAAEVDVIAKNICGVFGVPNDDIRDYQKAFTDKNYIPRFFEPLPQVRIFVPRYGLQFVPFENWGVNKGMEWWHGYNKVKHERSQHFEKANLKNALNAMGALLIMNLYHARMDLSSNLSHNYTPNSVTRWLKPDSTLLRLPEKYYDNPNPPPF